MQHQITQFNFPTPIIFGPGARKRLSEGLTERKGSRVLLVTDRGLMSSSIPKMILDDLKKTPAIKSAEIFSEIWGNPVKAQVEQGVIAFHAMKADSIVALGGGAVVDVAKAIALMVHHPGDLFDYEDGKPDARAVDQAIPLLVALPTTAGTGSEVGRSTVISDDQTKIKKIIFSPKLLPQAVYADPELTIDLPPTITAATGMDALTHLVEAYLAKGFHPICDGIALEGMKLVSKSLKKCVHDGKNLEMRGLMLVASMMGAIAFQKGLGVTHSCAHALSTVCNLHHGLANGILIPYTMKFNLDVSREKFQSMAHSVGSKPESPEGFISWLVDLKENIKVPATLSEVHVKKEHLERLVEVAMQDVCHQLNPKEVTREDFERIFQEAME